MSHSTCPSSLPPSLLLLLPLLLFFFIPFDFGHFDLFHVLLPITPQNHTVIGHELLPISKTSAISEVLESTPLPPFRNITSTNTSEISEDFLDRNLTTFDVNTETNASQINSVDLLDGHLSDFNATTDTNASVGIASINEGEQVIKKRSSTWEKIDVGLARARAAIRRAVLTRNYTSHKQQSYVPRGPIYRNAYAFHQLRQILHPLIMSFPSCFPLGHELILSAGFVGPTVFEVGSMCPTRCSFGWSGSSGLTSFLWVVGSSSQARFSVRGPESLFPIWVIYLPVKQGLPSPEATCCLVCPRCGVHLYEIE